MTKQLFLFLFLAIASGLQAQQDCRYSNILERYNAILPLEKIYAHTDRSFYEPGETLWFKAYLTDAALSPTQVSAILRAELIDPKGNPVKKLQLQVQDGSTHGEFNIAQSAVGGIYKLRIYTAWQENFSESLIYEKDITVQKSLLPNILMHLDFMRESYGPGSKVIAKFKLRSKDNYALAEHKVDYILMLAGKQIFSRSMETNTAGHADIEFELPKDLQTADALLNVMVAYDGKVESISRAVPISTKNIDLQFLPEGGNLVGATEQTVAFKALNEFGKPADVEATIYNEAGKEIAKIRSYHQGMGSFQFRPEAGSSYSAKITEPKGIDKVYKLPVATKNIGLQMQSQKKEELTFNIYSPKAEPLCIIVQMQDKVQFEIGLEANVGNNEIRIPTNTFPLGIAQITVFDAKEKPHAERLVFVNKHRQVQLEVRTNQSSYQIRDSILLDITVRDETGRGLQGDFSLAVVDDKLWTFADDKQAHILSQLLLCSDLKGEVYEPNFYFDPKEPKADRALDYLMLTQGWRRYDWKELLKKDSTQLFLEIKKQAEPNRIVEGYLRLDGKALANYKIQLVASKYKHSVSPKFVVTDEKGYFNIPNIEADCPIILKVNHRGFKTKSSLIDLHLKKKEELINAPQNRKTGVAFYNAVNQSNTIFPSAKAYYNKAGNYVEYDATDIRYSNSGVEGKGRLSGQVSDEDGEPLAFANLLLYQGGTTLQLQGTSTDFDGEYNFANIPSGEYDLVLSYIGYPDKKIIGLQLGFGQDIKYDLKYETEEMLAVAEVQDAVIISSYRIPLIAQDATTSGQTISAQDIQRMTTRNVRSIAATTAGVTQKDEGEAINSNGSRATSDDVFVDGVRVIGKAKVRTNNTTSTISTSNMNENSAYVEIQRSMGNNELFNYGNGRSGISRERSLLMEDAPEVNLSISKKGKSAISYGKNYYAPNYTAYHAKKSKPYKAIPIRKDFRNTVFWQPYVRTDSMGKAQILYYHSDATGSFRVIMEGISKGGKIGHAEHVYSVQMPFELEVKMPKFLCAGDTLALPILLRNKTSDSINGSFSITMPMLMTCLDSSAGQLKVGPNQTLKHTIHYIVKHGKMQGKAHLRFQSDGFDENLIYPITINPKGFPMHANVSGNKPHFKGKLVISDTLPGSLNAKLEVHTSNIESLLSALAGMIREPYGCFEQVSSSNYPNILALEMMDATNSIQAGVYDRAQSYLANGYKKLAGYESTGGGFEWFGGPIGHEGLSAFGLMEFYDMQRVYKGIDQTMTQRATTWLLSRRNQNGGWKTGSGYNHGWGKSAAVSDAYILHALCYIGERGLEKELQAVSNEALKSKDLYRLGLATLANYHYENITDAKKMATLLFETIEEMGLDNLHADHSITYSSGNALKSEILGLAILVGLEAKTPDMAMIYKYSSKLISLRSGGYFGNTQATVWALKALTAVAIIDKKQSNEAGQIVVMINGEEAFKEKLSSQALHNISADKLAPYLVIGENFIEIDIEGMATPPPYSLNVNWQTFTPPTNEGCSMRLRTKLATNKTKVGETVRLSASLTNLNKEKSAPTPMAVIGIPGGLSVQPWQLKELQEKGVFDFYELSDDYLILYYRGMDAGAEKVVHLDLKADVPGMFKAPASSAYLYYSNADKHWVAGERCRVE